MNELEPAALVKAKDLSGNFETPSNILLPPTRRPTWQILITACVMGLFFGVFFDKSHVFEPANIRGQFVFKRWIMLKMFLGAVSSSSFAFAAASKVFPARFNSVRQQFGGACKRGVLHGAAFGGMLLGAGMALAGACPGMVLSQVGTGTANSGITLLGGACGALTAGLLQPTLNTWLMQGALFGDAPLADLRWKHRLPNYVLLAPSLGVACLAVVVLLEVAVPWETELTAPNAPNCTFSCASWPPSIAGALIGVLQLPAVSIVGSALGSSRSYMTAVSQFLILASQETREKFTELEACRNGPQNWWQVVYVASVILGSFLSCTASNTYGIASGVTPAAGFLGGFCMLFGARCGAGCTSGHGLSGMPLLVINAYVGVMAMFAAGIAVAFTMDAFGVLDVGQLQ